MDPFQIIAAEDLDSITKMLDDGVQVGHTRWSGFSLLHRAAQLGNTDICQILIDRGADVNIRSAKGWYTPLHCALANGYAETAEYLITRGANPGLLSKYKEDPFDYGAKKGYKGICTDLRNKTAKMEMVHSLRRANQLLRKEARSNSNSPSRKTRPS
jgi:ankyrin repeat protein